MMFWVLRMGVGYAGRRARIRSEAIKIFFRGFRFLMGFYSGLF